MRIYTLLLKHPSGQSLFRAITTVFAITLATLMILTTISLGQGWLAQDQKTDLATNLFSATTFRSPDTIKNPIYLSVYESEFNSLSIREFGIRKTHQADILPLGLTDTPSDNELWVTPGLKRLIDKDALLAERYVKYDIRTLFPSRLAPSPDSLMLLYQIPSGTLHAENSGLQVSSATQLWSKYGQQNEQNHEYASLRTTLLLSAGIIIIIPVLLLVTEITRIGITQREKRYAALNLIGITGKQIRLLTALETLPLSF